MVWTAIAVSAAMMTGLGMVSAPAQAQGSARVITCESRDGRSQTCPAKVGGGVRIVRQLSQSPCVRGRSWGVSRGTIWVSDGCRAQFVLGEGGGGPGWGPGWGGNGGGSGIQPRPVHCASENYRERFCPVPGARGARLVRQTSKAPCIRGQTWRPVRDGVRVREGCAGDFASR